MAVEIKPSYRNMKYKLDEVPHVVEYADEAIRRAGVTPHRPPVRGGPRGDPAYFDSAAAGESARAPAISATW